MSIGVPDTAGYFAKELDLFDTTVRMRKADAYGID